MNIKKIKLFIYVSMIISIMFSFSIFNVYAESEEPNFGFKEGYQWYVNGDVGYFNFHVSIGGSDLKEFIQAFDYFNAIKVKRVKIVINSPGGDLYAATAIAQLMLVNNDNILIETYGLGFVASGATLLLMAGTEGYRFVYDGTVLMIHQVATLDYGGFKNQEERDRELERIKFIQNHFENFYLKKLKIGKEELKKMLASETWFDAKRALEIGLIDKIIKVN